MRPPLRIERRLPVPKIAPRAEVQPHKLARHAPRNAERADAPIGVAVAAAMGAEDAPAPPRDVVERGHQPRVAVRRAAVLRQCVWEERPEALGQAAVLCCPGGEEEGEGGVQEEAGVFYACFVGQGGLDGGVEKSDGAGFVVGEG